MSTPFYSTPRVAALYHVTRTAPTRRVEIAEPQIAKPRTLCITLSGNLFPVRKRQFQGGRCNVAIFPAL